MCCGFAWLVFTKKNILTKGDALFLPLHAGGWVATPTCAYKYINMDVV